ncbi:hypothetical protein CEXT_715711 [Caerostris extrusa]|uniref:Uncharacterized protein n=1 Tax=Caerostris extrusa TaxID=172846 RepID=A0AAV4PAN9_CAEEX|nr:hypothetical protein CEXT_715711 [Caerostris extrusa]
MASLPTVENARAHTQKEGRQGKRIAWKWMGVGWSRRTVQKRRRKKEKKRKKNAKPTDRQTDKSEREKIYE